MEGTWGPFWRVVVLAGLSSRRNRDAAILEFHVTEAAVAVEVRGALRRRPRKAYSAVARSVPAGS
jgi:hypothetical protein